MNQRMVTGLLAKWASLRRQLRAANEQAIPSWLPVSRMISATKPILQANRDEARRLLEASNKLFAPLKDPFETPLGLHRWLNAEREEAYSDWLAWVIEQLATPESIVQLLCGERDAELLSKCTGSLSVHRETVFETSKGIRRTDIEIFFGEKKVVLIEVKMIEADRAVADQLHDQAHYGAAFEKRLLLAPSGEAEAVPKGFTLLLWRDICLRLRRLVPSIWPENLSVAAMALAFLGAVEENVLQMPSIDQWSRVTSETLDYLKESLERDMANA